ncbi:MAG: sugar phosphate nucleotidyltransferase [bacterium]
MNPTLLILAAGMGSRYGGLKQVAPVGPSGETLMDYAVYDALQAGFDRVVFVIRREFAADFRQTVGRKYEGRVAVAYAFQAMDDLPSGFSVPVDRSKPWGTAHAIRAAREAVHTPFAVINADDFYGRDAFVRLGTFLRNARTSGSAGHHFAMVGYRLDQTLSEHGTVARGICCVAPDGLLQDVREMTRILPVPGGAENREDETSPVRLTGRESVSMNFWGFTRELMDELEALFPSWLQANAANPKAEWYIPAVVNELVQQRRADVRVLPTESQWFGVTYREDQPRSAAAVRQLVDAGIYPGNLWP